MATAQASSPATSNPTLVLPPASSQPSSKTHLSRPSTAVSVPSSQISSTVASEHDTSPEDDDDVNSAFHHEAYGPEPGEKGYDKYEVRFEADDPASPYNWSRLKRWYITILGGILVLNASVQSVILSTSHLLTLRMQDIR